MITLYKKGDKLNCNNYIGISLLNSAYKVFSDILQKHFESIADRWIGKYHGGFRKLTIYHANVVQLVTKKYKFRHNI